MGWKLSEWNAVYGVRQLATGRALPVMTSQEITEGVKYLRDNNYPKPDDCPETNCPKYRLACKLNICRIAVGMCGDF